MFINSEHDDILNKAGRMNNKSAILTSIESVVKLYKGLNFEFNEVSDSYADAVMTIKCDNAVWNFDAGIKSTINPSVIGQFLQKLPLYKNPPVLITSYVNSKMAEELRSRNINFIDTAGNAFVYSPPLVIDIQGNKPIQKEQQVNRMYRSSGLKIIFTLLCNPGLENVDYRTLSKMSNVALGSVGWVMRDLKQNGYLKESGKKGYRLVNKEDLLQQWVSNYHNQLRPKITLGRYSSIKENWINSLEINETMLWGSEYAAKIITNYLRPEQYTMYIHELKTEFLIKNRFHKMPDGNIEILNKFWSFDNEWTNQHVVPPLLIYADLIISKLDRNIETAKMIYDKELIGVIKQD